MTQEELDMQTIEAFKAYKLAPKDKKPIIEINCGDIEWTERSGASFSLNCHYRLAKPKTKKFIPFTAGKIIKLMFQDGVLIRDKKLPQMVYRLTVSDPDDKNNPQWMFDTYELSYNYGVTWGVFGEEVER